MRYVCCNEDHYVTVQSLLLNICDLFSIIEFFNEMEMEINIISNKIFTKSYLKIKVRGKKSS